MRDRAMARYADDQAVVVGVDGSAEGVDALRYAAGAAESRGMWLLVVHAYQLPPQGSAVTASGLAAAALAAAYRVTTDALSQVTVPAGVDVETAAELTTPLLMLQRLSGQVAMIVLGQHRADPSDSALIRPVGSSVAAAALCPIVIVPAHWSRNRTLSPSVVVGLDAETAAGVVLDFAFGEADRRGWSVVALQTLPLAVVPADRPARAADLAKIMAGLRQNHPGVPVTMTMTPDKLAQVILDGSRHARLLVVGPPKRRIDRPGAWSLTAARPVLAQLYCPVAMVPKDRRTDRGRDLSEVTLPGGGVTSTGPERIGIVRSGGTPDPARSRTG